MTEVNAAESSRSGFDVEEGEARDDEIVEVVDISENVGPVAE